jgi:hypothetical protein
MCLLLLMVFQKILSDIKMFLKDVGCENVNCICLAQDRI